MLSYYGCLKLNFIDIMFEENGWKNRRVIEKYLDIMGGYKWIILNF